MSRLAPYHQRTASACAGFCSSRGECHSWPVTIGRGLSRQRVNSRKPTTSGRMPNVSVLTLVTPKPEPRRTAAVRGFKVSIWKSPEFPTRTSRSRNATTSAPHCSIVCSTFAWTIIAVRLAGIVAAGCAASRSETIPRSPAEFARVWTAILGEISPAIAPADSGGQM